MKCLYCNRELDIFTSYHSNDCYQCRSCQVYFHCNKQSLFQIDFEYLFIDNERYWAFISENKINVLNIDNDILYVASLDDSFSDINPNNIIETIKNVLSFL